MDTFKQVTKSVMGAKDTVVDAAIDAKDSVVDAAIDAKDSVVDAAVDAKDSVFDAAKDAKDTVVDMARSAKETVLDLADRVMPGNRLSALPLLTKDHELVSAYFAKLGAVEESMSEDIEGLFGQLRYELETHATVEEQLFYPFMRKSELASKLITRALSDHAHIKSLLKEISALQFGSREWRAGLRLLKTTVEEHVALEEGQIFAAARELYDEDELQRMGVHLERQKQTLASEELPAAEPKTRRSVTRKSRSNTTADYSHSNHRHH